MNKAFLRGLVNDIIRVNKDGGKYVVLRVSFWGFSHTFYVDINDDLLNFLQKNKIYDFEGKIYKGKRGLEIKLLGVREVDDR